MTPHPEWQLGRPVTAGDTIVMVHDLSALEARAALRAAGSGRVEPGQRARLIAMDHAARPFDGVVTSVAPAGVDGMLDVRVALPPGVSFRPGTTGRIRVIYRRSSLLGALWWSARARIRNDLML